MGHPDTQERLALVNAIHCFQTQDSAVYTNTDETMLRPHEQKIMGLIAARPRTLSSFGIGGETVFDESVRRAWEIAPSDDDSDDQENSLHHAVMLGIDDWITYNLQSHFIPPGTRIRADVHKVCVYETGGFFKQHADTIREPNHFATLVRVLNCSTFEGGELIVDDQPISDNMVVFRCHVPHEVRPVRAGSRVSVVYNLILEENSESTLNAENLTAYHVSDTHHDDELLGNVIKALRTVVANEGCVAIALLQFAPVNATHLHSQLDALLRDATQGEVRAFVISEVEDQQMNISWFRREYLSCPIYFGSPSELKTWYHQHHCDYMGNEAQPSHLISFGHALLVTAANLGL